MQATEGGSLPLLLASDIIRAALGSGEWDRALDILELCVRDEEIDPELFRLFHDAQICRLAPKPS